MSEAYRSTVDISLGTPAGLLIRQTHHWAAHVFIVAIVLHLLRVFFTGAFRKPRELNWYIGLTMLMLALLEGFLGYSLRRRPALGHGPRDRLLGGAVDPMVGANLALWLWDGAVPRLRRDFRPRMYIAHVLLLPVLIAAADHRAPLLRRTRCHHTQFRGPGRTEANVVGIPAFGRPRARARSVSSAPSSACSSLLGGLVQINPIWLWGPYETWLGTNGAQPDWYLGWLIGALRLMPGVRRRDRRPHRRAEPVLGRRAVPGRRLRASCTRGRGSSGARTGDDARAQPARPAARRPGAHRGRGGRLHLRRRHLPGRLGRQVFVEVGIPYERQIWLFRIAAIVVPAAVFLVTRSVARELRDTGWHPLRGADDRIVRRTGSGGFD